MQYVILKEYAAGGTYRFPAVASMRLVTDVFAYAAANVPRFKASKALKDAIN